MEEKAQLKATVKALTAQVTTMQANWENEFAGARRHYEGEIQQLQQNLQQLERLKDKFYGAIKPLQDEVVSLREELCTRNAQIEVYAQDQLADAAQQRSRARSMRQAADADAKAVQMQLDALQRDVKISKAETELADRLREDAEERLRKAEMVAAKSKQVAEAAKQKSDAALKAAYKKIDAAETASREAKELLKREKEDAASAAKSASDAAYANMLMARQVERAKARAERLEQDQQQRAPKSRTAEEWEELEPTARRVAHHRERQYLKGIFDEHNFHGSDVATALSDAGLLEQVFAAKEMRRIYFAHVRELMQRLETDHFGSAFVFYLYYNLNLKFDKILEITRAASMQYDKVADLYRSKVLWRDPDDQKNVIWVPRIAPPRSRYEPVIHEFEVSLRRRLASSLPKMDASRSSRSPMSCSRCWRRIQCWARCQRWMNLPTASESSTSRFNSTPQATARSRSTRWGLATPCSQSQRRTSDPLALATALTTRKGSTGLWERTTRRTFAGYSMLSAPGHSLTCPFMANPCRSRYIRS